MSEITQNAIILSVLSLIDEIPVKDGINHPAEYIINKALSDYHDDLCFWLLSFIRKEKNSTYVESIVKLVGRVIENNHDEQNTWGYEFMYHALSHEDVGVRDESVQALEAWSGPTSKNLLNNHVEEVPWLRDYIERVILHLNLQELGNRAEK
jgi:hypothetical protein